VERAIVVCEEVASSHTPVFFPPMYKIPVKEARWGAAFPGNSVPVFKIEGNVPHLRARPVHFVGHLPRSNGTEFERCASIKVLDSADICWLD
jgi:hypothetical protein